MAKRVITEADVVTAAEAGAKTMDAPLGEVIVTPGARDKAMALGIDLAEDASCSSGACPEQTLPADAVVSQVTSLLKSRIPTGLDSDKLESLVREVVTARMADKPAPPQAQPRSASVYGGWCVFYQGQHDPRGSDRSPGGG